VKLTESQFRALRRFHDWPKQVGVSGVARLWGDIESKRYLGRARIRSLCGARTQSAYKLRELGLIELPYGHIATADITEKGRAAYRENLGRFPDRIG
jgi:hypothetical protein